MKDDSDLPQEQPLGGDEGEFPVDNTPVVPAAARPAEEAEPTPRTELDFNEDSDLLSEAEASGGAAEPEKPFYGERHWTNEHVFGHDEMVKERPANYAPRFTLIVPTMSMTDTEKVGNALAPVMKHLAPAARTWVEKVLSSQLMVMADDQFTDALERDGSMWIQRPEYDGTKLVAQVPGVVQPAAGAILSGQDAEIHMAQQTGKYARLMFPLVHTGIWLNVQVPEGDELHTLEEHIAAAKYELGWLSKGLVYSNTSVMQNIILANFILERAVASSAEVTSLEFLKKVIRITDLNLMAAHMASAIYPSGFPLERPCSASPQTCHEITKGILRLSKIIWVDSNGLSIDQKKFMATRLTGRKKTEADFKKYQEQFPGVTQRVEQIAPNIWVRFMPPTLEQYEQSGYDWIDSIERDANQVLSTPSGQQLNSYMQKQYQLTSMRQYAHWVDAIIYPNDVQTTGREDINNLLAKNSSNTEMVEKFMKAVKRFIDDCTVGLVGINNYDCPKCGNSQTAEAVRNPKLIPLDPMHTFFTLSGLKTQTIQSANMAY
jgi:hypothetical protein